MDSRQGQTQPAAQLRLPDEPGAIVYDPVKHPGLDEIAGMLATRISGAAIIRAVESQAGLGGRSRDHG